ncbi:MAG: tyrosine-type recombinase/integrase [Desulfovibrio sp.]|jgi:integrase|nr:tyrosine-type recombinase/integrase [Desulfovibrio sp.]
MENGVEYVIHYKGRQVASFKTAWANTLKRAGITRRIRPYDLRHAFATEAIAAGVDVGTTAQIMGHTSPTMLLEHYQHVADKQKRAAVEALPDIPKLRQKISPQQNVARP